MTFRLGRLPHQSERLARGLMSAPAPMPYQYQLDRNGIAFQPGMWGNDALPDCTTVGIANSATALGLVTSAPPVIADGKPQALYANIIGQPNATQDQLAATDGAMVMDVLDYVATHGFDAGEQVPLVPVQRFAVHNAREAIAGVMCNVQTVTAYLGIRLYQRDMDTFGQAPWVASIADSGAAVGGHLLLAWDYVGLGDADLVWLATWGALQPASWAWLMERLDEAHGLEWPQLAAA